MAEFLFWNPNPRQRYHKDGKPIKKDMVGDCSIRGVARALDATWEEAFKMMFEQGLKLHNMLESAEVVGAVLMANGFEKGEINQGYIKRHHQRPTVDAITRDVEKQIGLKDRKIVCLTNSVNPHITCVDEGVIYDLWDTSDEPVYRFWYK